MSGALPWIQVISILVGFTVLILALGRWAGMLNTKIESQGTKVAGVEDKLEALKIALFGLDGTPSPFFRHTEARLLSESIIQRNEATDRRMDEHSRRIGALEARD